MRVATVASDIVAGLDGRRGWRWAMAGLAVAAVVIRMSYFGDPLVDPDEQFYLLVGDSMWHGAIPYITIWDRKPVGLFLLYAAIRLLGGDGIIQYQVVATVFAGATAIVIATLARRVAPPCAAIVAASLYLLSLNLSGGAGGQAPVFYNLLIASAAWLIVTAPDRPPTAAVRRGALAMLLVGLALQIKYSVMIEAAYCGLALGWIGWRAGLRGSSLIGALALWTAAGLLPTALAFGYFAAIGHGAEFYYANFVSIGQRGPYSHEYDELTRIVPRMLPLVLPMLLALGARPWRGGRDDGATYRLIAGWAFAALISFVTFGSFFNHYALPLLVPFAVLAAAGFAIRWRHSGAALALLALAALTAANVKQAGEYQGYLGDAAYAARVAAAIEAHRGDGCLFVYFGDPIYYQMTGSCLPTRWAFPYHLSLTREQPALGIDAMAELKRILDSRPTVILDRTLFDDNRSAVADALLGRYLARDYRLVGTFALRADATRVWALQR